MRRYAATDKGGIVSENTNENKQPGREQDTRWATRITFLRSRAAVARAEVSALEAMHRDPEILEDLLANAAPEEVALAEAVEHRISERVAAASQIADAAEADYERAVLDGADLLSSTDLRLDGDSE